MIPKVIHYCWFGKKDKPELALKCILSWQKFCPDYKIIEWNEDNVNISACPDFVQTAYNCKKWAFVSDYIRLKVVYENGGIYLDTDVEILKPLDDLLDNKIFLGCEGTMFVATGLGFGAERHTPLLKDNMIIYENINPINSKGEFEVSPCPHYTTELLKERGVVFPINQVIVTSDGIKIFPNDYFNPFDWKFRKLCITQNTYSIHHYCASWMTPESKQALIQDAKNRIVEKRWGKTIAKIYDFCFWAKKKNGGPGLIKKILQRH